MGFQYLLMSEEEVEGSVCKTPCTGNGIPNIFIIISHNKALFTVLSCRYSLRYLSCSDAGATLHRHRRGQGSSPVQA